VLPLHFIVLLAGIQGLSEALPVSRSGHDAVAWLFFEPGPSGPQLESFLHLATASALIFAARKRLVAAAGAGLLAIARPTLFRSSAPARDAAVMLAALGGSLISTSILELFIGPWKTTPVAAGFGFLLTGMLLTTTILVNASSTNNSRNGELSVPFAFMLGLGQGMATLPGGSHIGVALVLSSWMGLKNDFALDLALFLSATALLDKCLHAALFGVVLPDISWPMLMVAFVTAFLGTIVAIGATRVLLEKRSLALAACWIVPLGLATLAYSRASSEGLSLAPIF